MKNKFTTILIDDEPLSFTVIEEYLKPFESIEVIAKCTKSKSAVEKIISLKPDLLFLDIQMPVMNGFELIEAIINKHNPYIIFTTAYEQYALQAFEVNAIGYLLKPFAKDKFSKAILKFLSFQENKKESELLSGLEKLLTLRTPSTDYLDKIMVKEAKKIFFIPVADIIYFEAAGDYVKAVTASKTHLINDSLHALETKLSPELFIRIHRSHTVNMHEVKEFLPHFNGEYQVVMRNGNILKLSRNYKDPVSRLFKGI